MAFNVGFIGGGNMSTAIFTGIIKSDAHAPSNIWVSGPHLENLKHWERNGAKITQKNIKVFQNCDIIILGVKPGMLKTSICECMDGLLDPTIKKNKLFVSMLSGVSLHTLYEELAPLYRYANVKVIRIMPNTPVTVGHGVCLYTPGENVTEDEISEVTKLLKGSSVCVNVNEHLINTLGVLTACGPALMYMVIEALSDGAVKQGVPRDLATKFASQMMIGSGHMVLDTGKHPGLLKDEVCSPGGSTICAVSALENGNVRASFINAIEAATNKTLGK